MQPRSGRWPNDNIPPIWRVEREPAVFDSAASSSSADPNVERMLVGSGCHRKEADEDQLGFREQLTLFAMGNTPDASEVENDI